MVKIIWYAFILVAIRTIIDNYTLYYPQSGPQLVHKLGMKGNTKLNHLLEYKYYNLVNNIKLHT